MSFWWRQLDMNWSHKILKDKSFLFIVLDQNPTHHIFVKNYNDSLNNIYQLYDFMILFSMYQNLLSPQVLITLAASIALATVMNCCGETDLSSHRLRKVWSEPDLLFDISTPLSRVRIFHPSFPFPNLLESEADNSSCMQFSLAKCTYLLNESSLIDLKTNSPIRKVKWNGINRSKGERNIYQDLLQGVGLFISGFKIVYRVCFLLQEMNRIKDIYVCMHI